METRTSDILVAGTWAAILGGVPSTAWALATGGDPLEATRAAGAMLVSPASSTATLVGAAMMVHLMVNFFWATVLVLLLPVRGFVTWSILAAILIGLLDLKVIAPAFFPEVYALAFWPQMADHVAWGTALGVARAIRVRRRADAGR